MTMHAHETIDAKEDFLRQFRNHQLERAGVLKAGHSALWRLVRIARNDTGQAVIIRRFLLSLYNGYSFPFDLTRFRSLDKQLFADCMAVLTMDARYCIQEIHEYIDNGGVLFDDWAARES